MNITIIAGARPNFMKIAPIIEADFKDLLSGHWKQGQTPELWNGKAAKRITDCLVDIYSL